MAMKAITRIEETGMSTPRIAEAIHVTTHAVRHYKLMKRFPNKHVYTSLVLLARQRGVTLLASDFITDGSFIPQTEMD
jgi:predicted transcriptional regulator